MSRSKRECFDELARVELRRQVDDLASVAAFEYARLDALETHVEALEARVDALEARAARPSRRALLRRALRRALGAP